MGAVLAALSVGCGEVGDDGRFSDAAGSGGAGGAPGPAQGEGGAGGDGAAGPNFDGGVEGVEDVDQFLADPQRNPSDFLSTDAPDTGGYIEAAAACFTASDACGASECGAFASCCVDTGSCCKPNDNPSLPGLLDFEKCAGQTLEGCVAGAGFGASTFGELEPVVTVRGLIPNGTATSEAGGVIGEPVNLASERVQIDVEFVLPIGCNGTCLESAGVAFTASEPGIFVDADVGLLLGGSREVVNLMIGDAVADTFDAGTGGTTWSLILSPSGSVEVQRDRVSMGTYSFDAASLAEARFVVFGRNLGAATTSAAIARIDIDTLFCDSPRSWVDRMPMLVAVQGSPSPAHAGGRSPSIAMHQATTRVAFEVDGEIFVGDREVPGQVDLADAIPVLFATEPYESMGLQDPELESDGSFMHLFYTARDDNGAGSIGAAVSAQDPALFVKSPAPILVPSGNVVSFDAPSVVFRDGLWLMVVRATLSTDATELRAYYANDVEGPWNPIIDGTLGQLTRVDDPTSEITDPSLIVHNSAYHLYYGRRNGTRWSVELVVSDELLLWRSLGESLGGSGEGFDSLGARSADAISRTDQIDLVYAGQDGVSFQLGSASRAAPSGTAPSIF